MPRTPICRRHVQRRTAMHQSLLGNVNNNRLSVSTSTKHPIGPRPPIDLPFCTRLARKDRREVAKIRMKPNSRENPGPAE